MKKILIIVLCFFIPIIITACTENNADSGLQIAPPQIQKLPLQGTWEVVSLIDDDESDEENLFGKNIYFTDDYVLLNDYLLSNPRYQIRRVDSEAYLLYNHQAYPQGYNFKEAAIDILTLYEGEQFFCEFVRESEDELLLIFSNRTYLVKQVSNEVDESALSSINYSAIPRHEDKTDDNNISTGVLLGLRTPSNGAESYRTLWISLENNELSPVLETDDIFFPRRSGFYQLEVYQKQEGNKEEDFLIVNNILLQDDDQENDYKDELAFLNWDDKEGSIHRKIIYIGNDYISLEEITRQKSIKDNSLIESSKLKIVAVDSLPGLKGIKISDLAGIDAITTMEQGKEKLQQKMGIEQPINLDEENYGLTRKMGYWIFNGRLSYLNKDKYMTEDYNISIIPPDQLVYYNELKIPWTNVKNQVPFANDVFTSPNNDIALVITDDDIIIYRTYKENIINPPLKKIPLNEGEKVIMAEWASGDYVENWTLNFKDYLSQNNSD